MGLAARIKGMREAVLDAVNTAANKYYDSLIAKGMDAEGAALLVESFRSGSLKRYRDKMWGKNLLQAYARYVRKIGLAKNIVPEDIEEAVDLLKKKK